MQLPADATGLLRTVVLSETPAAGLDEGIEMRRFGIPSLNSIGEVAFTAFLAGDDIDLSNDFAIFSADADSSLELIARRGDLATGAVDGGKFGGFFIPNINSSREVLFRSGLIGDAINTRNDFVIYKDGIGTESTLIAREGDDAPDTDVSLGSPNVFHEALLNSDGDTAFRTLLRGFEVNDTNDAAIFKYSDVGGLELVAREGDPVPGTELGVRFAELNTLGPTLNGNGETAFRSSLTGVGVTAFNNSAVFRAGSEGVHTVVREGENAFVGSEILFAGFSDPVMNDSGKTAFVGLLVGDGVVNSNDRGVFRQAANGSHELVAREGDQVPGLGPEVNFSVFSSYVLNGNNQIAIRSILTGAGVDSSNNTAILSDGQGAELRLIARAGDAAPETPVGVNFGGPGGFQEPVMNRRGQVAFLSFLTGPGVDPGLDDALFAQSVTGELKLIARAGDLLDVSDDPLTPEFRTVSGIAFAGGSGLEDGRRSGFNDQGQVSFVAFFTDGTTGVFVSDLVAVPEPGTFRLILAALCLTGGRRRST